MFNLAPLSLWLEDYSALKALFQRWREEGVDDLEAYLRADPSLLAQSSAALRVLQVNQRTLDLFAAPDQVTLVAQLGQIFRDDMHHSLVRELVQLWEGRLEYSNESVNYALDGRRLDVRVNVRVLPGHEEDWSRVLVSLEDITRQMQDALQLRRSEQYARGLFEYSPCRCGLRTSAPSRCCSMACVRRESLISKPFSKYTQNSFLGAC